MIAEARQLGMMMGLKFTDPMLGPMMTVAGIEAGLLIVYANHDTSVIQLLPPLIIEAEQVEEIVGRLDGALTAVFDTVASANSSMIAGLTPHPTVDHQMFLEFALAESPKGKPARHILSHFATGQTAVHPQKFPKSRAN